VTATLDLALPDAHNLLISDSDGELITTARSGQTPPMTPSRAPHTPQRSSGGNHTPATVNDALAVVR
jgi:hypothetical protein